MSRVYLICFLLFKCTTTFSQSQDSLAVDRWTNYMRLRGVGDNYIQSIVSMRYITHEGDTLVRDLSISSQFHQVLKEQTLIHNKQNGLEITYYPNGAIQEISYYLNGRLWEAISRSDSNGRLQNPGDLHNGTGTRFFFDQVGVEPNCYETYKNGLPEGPFYWQSGLTTCIKGELTYKPSVVEFQPAKKVTYTVLGGDKVTALFDTALFRNIFISDDSKTGFKVLSVFNDSLPERSHDYKYINIKFDDPAIIPRGIWQVTNTKSGKAMVIVEYDNNANPIKVTQFNENGQISSVKSFPSFDKRRW